VQRQADVILANVYRIEPGAAVLQAEDWDTGEAISIALDPTKTAVEQAEGLYRSVHWGCIGRALRVGVFLTGAALCSLLSLLGAMLIARTAVEAIAPRPQTTGRRARKLRRAVDAVEPLLTVAEADVEYLEQVSVRLSVALAI